MLSKTELKILKRMFDDLTKTWTIREVSIALNLPYPQIHRSVSSLIKKELISKEIKGKSSVLQVNLESLKKDHYIVEFERKIDILDKYKILNILENDLFRLKYAQFICILFGSYALKNAKKDSDIDLLFVIPEEYDYDKFEREVKTKLLLPKAHIQITKEKGLLDMWSNPSQLNVGNEIIKNHVILWGVEAFLRLRRNYYLGDK